MGQRPRLPWWLADVEGMHPLGSSPVFNVDGDHHPPPPVTFSWAHSKLMTSKILPTLQTDKTFPCHLNNINVKADDFTINIQKSTILDQHIFEFFKWSDPKEAHREWNKKQSKIITLEYVYVIINHSNFYYPTIYHNLEHYICAKCHALFWCFEGQQRW